MSDQGVAVIRPTRCALYGMAPHGGGYCGWGDYWSGDPFCRKCYATGDYCTHTAAERAEFDRKAAA